MATTSIGQSLTSQVRVIYACASRLLKLKTRETPLGMFSVLIEPIATICIMTLVFANVRFRVPRLGDYLMIFLMTGILPITVWKQSLTQTEQAFMKLRQLLVMPQVQSTDIMIAGMMNALIILSSLFLGFTLFFHYVYDMDWPQNLIFCFIPGICNALFGFGLCLINMVIKTWWSYWGTVFGVITAPVGVMSGMFYTIENIPQQAQWVLWYNPLMHSTELIRTYYFYEYTSTFFSPYYYYGTTLGSFMVGLMCERFFRYRLIGKPKK